ncbi:hypothetical protein Salat_2783400 [Sesamum alatum]|uniref:Uncharacterized protein n=1 Tax=Sesamum alatum TaxID=300844 RepID=A0AAE2C9B4_9LAMI|nr:hypothetical protein Salat_2783400 [Sesamum alatum]
MNYNNLLSTWEASVCAFELCFRPSSYESHRFSGLSPEVVLNCFLSSLRLDKQKGIIVFHPTNMSQVTAPTVSCFSSAPPFQATPPPPRQSLPLQTRVQFPIYLLSPMEMQARHAKGLRFNCNEYFTPGHKCRPKQFLLLLNDEHDRPDDSSGLEWPLPPSLPPEDTPSPLPTALSDSTNHQPAELFHLSAEAYLGSL